MQREEFVIATATVGAVTLGITYVQTAFVEDGAGSVFVCCGLVVVIPVGALIGAFAGICLVTLLRVFLRKRK